MLTSKDGTARFVATQRIHNFRDFGGYHIAGGGKLATGVLFRSGDTSGASQSDLSVISAIDPVVLVDLRGDSERAAAPCRWPPDLRARIFETDGESAKMAFHEEAAENPVSASSITEEFASRYENLPFRPHLQGIYAKYLEALATCDGPSMVFCTAGKDRTGVIVAILQTLLGVHSDDVMDEYLLTNCAPDSDAQISRLRTQIEHRFGKGLSEEAIRVVTRVDPAFLKRAFDTICEHHGSIEAYAETKLNCPASQVEALRATLIV